ncbi:MAG: aminotransferase class IV [Pseudomonadota bacterium]
MLIIRQRSSSDTTHSFDLRDRGLLLADGVFDTSLMVKGQMIFEEAHIQRLVRDAHALGISVSASEIEDFIYPIKANRPSGVLRITITRGPSERGLSVSTSSIPTMISQLSPLELSKLFQPLTLGTSDILRNSSSPTSKHKTLSYVDNIIAMGRAREVGFDNAMFINEHADICCAATGNLFLAIDGVWRTPPLSDGVLEGTMRGWLMRNASQIGIEIVEESISFSQLSSVDGAIMTNSIKLLSPINQIDDMILDRVLANDLIKSAKKHIPALISDLHPEAFDTKVKNAK